MILRPHCCPLAPLHTEHSSFLTAGRTVLIKSRSSLSRSALIRVLCTLRVTVAHEHDACLYVTLASLSEPSITVRSMQFKSSVIIRVQFTVPDTVRIANQMHNLNTFFLVNRFL